MGNYFTEYRSVMRKLYGEYCNVMRAENIEPAPYYEFSGMIHLSKKEERHRTWMFATRRFHEQSKRA